MRQGEITPPCGEPSVVRRRRPSSTAPAFSHLSIMSTAPSPVSSSPNRLSVVGSWTGLQGSEPPPVFQVNGSLLMALPSLRRVPASPVPRFHRYYEGATTSRSRNPAPLWLRLRAPRAPPLFVLAEALLTGLEAVRQAWNSWSAGVPSGLLRPWTRTGSHRFPGGPSHASALLQDPGRAEETSPVAVSSMLPPGSTNRRPRRVGKYRG